MWFYSADAARRFLRTYMCSAMPVSQAEATGQYMCSRKIQTPGYEFSILRHVSRMSTTAKVSFVGKGEAEVGANPFCASRLEANLVWKSENHQMKGRHQPNQCLHQPYTKKGRVDEGTGWIRSNRIRATVLQLQPAIAPNRPMKSTTRIVRPTCYTMMSGCG